MLSALFNSLIAASIVITPTPTVRNPIITEQQFSTTLAYCREDIKRYADGDTTWIEKQVVNLSEEDQRLVLTSCVFYVKGMVDGFEADLEIQRKAQEK